MSRSIKRPSALRALHLLTLLLLLNPTTAWTAADTLPTKAPHQKKGSKKHASGKKGHKAKKTHATVQVIQPKQKVHAIPGAIPARFLKLLRKEINRTVAQAKEEEQKAPEQRRQRRPNVGRKTHKRRVGARHKKRIARGKSKQKRRPKFLKKTKQKKMQKLAANDHIMQEIMNRKNRRQGGGKGGHKQKKHVKKRLQHPRAKLQHPRPKIKGGNIQNKIERERERVEKNMIADQYLKELQAKKAAGTTLTEQETTMLERLEQKKAEKKAIKALLLKDPKTLTPEEKKTLADHARAKKGLGPKHGGKQKVTSSKKHPARKPHKQAGKKIKDKAGKGKKKQAAIVKKAQVIKDDQTSADDQTDVDADDTLPSNTGIVPSKVLTKRVIVTEPTEEAPVDQPMALDEAILVDQPVSVNQASAAQPAAATDQAAADAAAQADYQQKMAEYNKQLAEYNAAVAAQQAQQDQASTPDQAAPAEQAAPAAQSATTDQAAADAAAEADYQQKMAEYNKQLAEYNAAVAAQQAQQAQEAQASTPDQAAPAEQAAPTAPDQQAPEQPAPSRRRIDQGLPPGPKGPASASN